MTDSDLSFFLAATFEAVPPVSCSAHFFRVALRFDYKDGEGGRGRGRGRGRTLRFAIVSHIAPLITSKHMEEVAACCMHALLGDGRIGDVTRREWAE